MTRQLRERLAAEAHKAWSGWKRHEFGVGAFNDDGTWTMPAWAVERWRRQMNTPYDELSEEEKESDRKEADRYLAILSDFEATLENEHGVIEVVNR
jgi:hypothetical protein